MIKMGFLEHFQEHNQTLENIFQSIFWNATKHLKIFSPAFILHSEFDLHQTKRSLRLINYSLNKPASLSEDTCWFLGSIYFLDFIAWWSFQINLF